MLELDLFGGVTLSRGGEPLEWPRRGWQRPALFALLAARGKRGCDRAQLADLLWPDSQPDDARHSLDELLSRTRREAGEPELFTTGAMVALNPRVITSDLLTFDAAVAASRLEQAEALYLGPFAAGLRIVRSPRLEQEIEAVRYAYTGRRREIVVRLARAAAASGATTRAIARWEQLVKDDRLDREAVIELATLFSQTGRLVPARSVINTYRHLAAEASGAEDPEVETIWERLRHTPGGTAPPELEPEDDFELKRRGIVERIVGASYRLQDATREESLSVVFAALPHSAPSARVDVHLLNPRIAASVAPQRFRAVFHRVRQLSHPGVLPLLDYFVAADGLVLVTAQATRPSLRDRVRQGALGVEQAQAIARQLADAMACAHELGVVHGNLGPRQVCFHGAQAIVGGFGIRELLARSHPTDDRSTVLALGNRKYQSPEQLIDDSVVDVATDVYALGCMLFEMLTGEAPFQRARHLDDPGRRLRDTAPRVRTVRAAVPASLDDIVARCLQLYPADRFPSARALHQALSE